MHAHFTQIKPIIAACFLWVVLQACYTNTDATSAKPAAVRDSVLQMMQLTAQDLNAHGPAAWLNHFENSDGFIMSSDGQLAFASYPIAQRFILDTLTKSIQHIKLAWYDIRVDSLSPTLASTGAAFTEELTGFDNKTVTVTGYFSALAHQTSEGWRLRNLHWSIKHGN